MDFLQGTVARQILYAPYNSTKQNRKMSDALSNSSLQKRRTCQSFAKISHHGSLSPLTLCGLQFLNVDIYSFHRVVCYLITYRLRDEIKFSVKWRILTCESICGLKASFLHTAPRQACVPTCQLSRHQEHAGSLRSPPSQLAGGHHSACLVSGSIGHQPALLPASESRW